MVSFELKNPTHIVFRDGQIARVRQLVAPGTKVLLLYGGGRRNGIYEQAVAALRDVDIVEFGGVEASPRYETILQAAAAARHAESDMILAIGGGSVIDAVVATLEKGGQTRLGESGDIGPTEVRRILELAA